MRDRRVAMLRQPFVAHPSMTVYETIASPLRLTRRPAAAIEAAVRRTAEMMKPTPMPERRPLELQGGRRRRRAPARARVWEAGLAPLDEPLADLDCKLREELRTRSKALHDEFGRTMISANHDRTEAPTFADEVVVMHDGRLVQIGTPQELFERPAHGFVGHASSARRA